MNNKLQVISIKSQVRKYITCTLVLATCYFSHAVEIKPVINTQLLGGQYFYNGQDNSFGGDASLVASPYIHLNDQWTVVPLYSGSYQGTKQVADLAGGGTLFQDSQDHRFSTKVIRSLPHDLKVKVVGSYGLEWLRETKDETWTKGLYDNHRTSGGTELEWDWTKQRIARLTYDYYTIHFPNYQSLESTQQGSGLGRELSQPNVLDNQNHMVGLSYETDLPAQGVLEGHLSYTRRTYGDQNIVLLSGSLDSETRHDNIHSISLEGTWPILMRSEERLFTTLGYAWSDLQSNQNHYDPGKQNPFNENYYSNIQHTLQNRWTLLLGDSQNPWTITGNGSLSRQQYANRHTQNALGDYESDVTHVDTAMLGLTFTYPIAQGFRLVVTTDVGWSNANTHYDAIYQYHYHTADYLLGFSYAY